MTILTIESIITNAIHKSLNILVSSSEVNLIYNAQYYNKKGRRQFQTAVSHFLAKKTGLNIDDITSLLIQNIKNLDKDNLVEHISTLKGFINIDIKDSYLLTFVNDLRNKDFDVREKCNSEKLIFIDFGGLNLCKDMHVGHLRSLFIGECMQRVYRYHGYKVVSDVHYGDIGTPIGLVIAYMLKENLKVNNIKDLNKLYKDAVRVQDSIYKEAQKIVRYLHGIDLSNTPYQEYWKNIVAISKKHNQKLFKMLNICFDMFEGESDAIPLCSDLVNSMRHNDYFFEDDGALIMRVKNKNYVLQKSDKAYLYITTDIATVFKRIKKYHPSKILYIVDLRQKDHFEGVAAACDQLSICPASNIQFLGFGVVTDKEGKILKTRQGDALSMREALKLLTKSMQVMYDDNNTNFQKEVISNLRFSMLGIRLGSNYPFDPNNILQRQGKTGSYVKYTLLRIKSLCKDEPVNFSIKYVSNNYERDILLHLYHFQKALDDTLEAYDPKIMIDYLYELSNLINSFYERVSLYNLSGDEKRNAVALYLTAEKCMQRLQYLLGW